MTTYHPRTLFLLRTIGVAPREMRALDVPVKHLTPEIAGFGLIGKTGSGKTWALVQALADDIESAVRESGSPDVALLPTRYARWLNWPDEAENLKGMVGQHYTTEIEDLVETWEECHALFLDDLGAERIVGEDDYSLGILRRVLDARYRQERPVYWTSNLNLKSLAGIYGARLISRVAQAWPATVIRGEDMRLGGVA